MLTEIIQAIYLLNRSNELTANSPKANADKILFK